MKNISKVHYITQEVRGKAHWQLAEEACRGGVQWVQLRIKNKSQDEWLDIALKTLAVCKRSGSKLIVNDNVAIARETNADGVHLGKTDMDITEARKILGDNAIIGATANTWDDVKILADKAVDYIGLGPYRFTPTKEKLSPVLGLAGYEYIISQCAAHGVKTSVIAIGGILRTDVISLLETGVYGVAIASSIGLASGVQDAAGEFVKLLTHRSDALTNSR